MQEGNHGGSEEQRFGRLIVSRKIGEKVVIGTPPNTIVITVVDVQPKYKARIGIECDRSIPVHRSELLYPPKENQAGS